MIGMYSVVIPCAGMGKRVGLGYNKIQYVMNNGKMIIENTVLVFEKDSRCQQIILVVKEEEKADFQSMISSKKVEYALGGKERQDSVRHGLDLVKNDSVLIHDGARPYLELEEIDALLTCLENEQACLLMTPAKDTIKIVKDGYVEKTLERSSLMHAQTPQAFKTDLIKDVHQQAKQCHYLATDDAMLVEVFSDVKVKVVLGKENNLKITTKEDLKRG